MLGGGNYGLVVRFLWLFACAKNIIFMPILQNLHTGLLKLNFKNVVNSTQLMAVRAGQYNI